MRILTDEEIAAVRIEAEDAYNNFEETDLYKMVGFDQRSLSDLVTLRASYQALMDKFDEKIALRVAQGRHVDASWAEIGAILGMSRQAAQQKFGDWVGPLTVGDGKDNLG